MEIRPVFPADVAALASMERACFSDPWGEEDIRALVTSDLAFCRLALSDGVPVGYLLGRLIAPEGELLRIATAPDKRRRGVAARLLAAALPAWKDAGAGSVYLEVRASNLPARALYRDAGFADIGIRKNYYRQPTEDACLMMYGTLPPAPGEGR